MLYILCPEETARLTFIVKLIFRQLLGVDHILVTSMDQVPDGAPVLNYTTTPIDNAYSIRPSRLLFEHHISEDTKLEQGQGNHLKLTDEDFFDPFASAFYLVSRYEEYQDYQPDAHDRFPSDQSVLHATGLLNVPVVNLWALEINAELTTMFTAYAASPRSFEFRTTIDIDQAWKYRYKGVRRTLGGFLGDLIRMDRYKLKERTAVLTGKLPDPFDNFQYQAEIHKRFNVRPNYFVEVGKRSKFDKNLPASNRHFADLIRKMDQMGVVGMHPSYTSNTNFKELQEENEQLEGVLGRKITSSRQHFLMHKMPQTFRNLLKLGIQEDHTLGYSTEPGFRAGIAAPFAFYDLEIEKETDLILYPFCMMDITPMHYFRLSIPRSKAAVKEQIEQVKACGGLYISLWHNESLSNAQQWTGWRELYEFILESATDSGKA